MSYTASYIVNSSSAQGTTDFTFTFPYIKEEHIEVYLNYNKITQGSGSAQYQVITNVSPKLIRLNTGITSANLRVEIRRNSSLDTPLVDYADGSTLTANDLDTSALQSLYIDQELKDNQGKTVSVDPATALPTLNNLRLTNVANPTAAQDAATKNYVDTKVFTSSQIQDGTITSADIADGTIVNADVNASAAIAGSKLQASTSSNAGSMSAADKAKIDGIETGATADQTNSEIRAAVEAATDSNVFTDADHTKLNAIEANATADQTNAEIRTAVEAATDSNVFTDADHTKLNGIETAATADQTAAEIKIAYESNAQTNPLTDAEKAVIDGVTSNTSELNKLDGVTASTTELNIVAGKSFKTSSGTLDTTSDTEIPSSKVIAAHVASSQTAIGGFTTIADEVSFPNTQPATGVVVSINNAAGVVINGSGVSTTGRRLDNTTVTINGFPSSLNSETLAAGVGLIVVSTSTANTYSYHKILTSETDVKQLSDDINDFNSRYRIASSAPGSNNDEGDLYFDTAANKMKVYNGSAWDDVASVGSFFVNTLSSSGSGSDTIPGGSATFNGTAKKFTLSNPGTSAQQHIVSINGVVQKPNSGTSVPSEGFAISGNDIIFSAAPASGSDFFIITCGSSVSIGTPSANSVNSSHIIDGSIVNGDVSNSANIAGSKIADDSIPEVKLDVHNAPATGKFLRYTSNGMEWDDVPAGVGGANQLQLNDSVKIKLGTDSEYEIYNDSSNLILDQTADGLSTLIRSKQNGNVTFDASDNGNQVAAKFKWSNDSTPVSSAELYYGGVKKAETVTGGFTVSGVCTATSFSGSGANLTNLPPAGNTFTALADGAIGNNKSVKIGTDGKVSEIKAVITTAGSHFGLAANGYGQVSSADVYALANVIGYNSDDDMYVTLSVESSGDFVYYTGVPNNNAASAGGITWSGRTVIHTGNAHRQPSICYAGNSRFLIVWREAQDTGLTKAIILKWNSGSSSASISSEQQIDGVSNSEYKGMQTVKIATDRVAILCRSGSSNSKWPDGIPGIIIGDITNDTTWTYRNQQRCTATTNASDHGAKDEHYSITYNSTDNVILCTWLKTANAQSLRTVAMSVASGTSATVTKGSDIELESNTQAGNQSTIWHSGQNKFVIGYCFDGSTTRKIRSKIATVNSSSLAITLSSAIDTSQDIDIDPSDYNLKLILNNVGTIYAYFIFTNYHIGVISAPNFNGSTVGWGNYSNNSSIYAGYYKSVDVVMGGSGSEHRHVYFGEATSGSDSLYISYKVQESSSNLTAAYQYVGFTDQAYTNGQTATIKTFGNNVTQSGLTAGSEYFIQASGSLATSADTLSCVAGVALASNKLLIKQG